jgi:hypothetical protein
LSKQSRRVPGLDEITRGNPEPLFELYSRRDDVTLANPYGLPGASMKSRPGDAALLGTTATERRWFETFAQFATADLGYVLEIERFEANVAARIRSARSRCA